MLAPPLLPPPHAPFSVSRGDDGILITLHAGAGQHAMLSQRQSSLWIQHVAGAVAVDLGRIPLLNSRIVGWLFGLIHDGPLTALDIRNANQLVHTQIRRIGLATFVAAPPARSAGQQSERQTAPEFKAAAVPPVIG